jgi:hypothetical protein
MLNKKFRRLLIVLFLLFIFSFLFYNSYFFLKIYSFYLNSSKGPVQSVLIEEQLLKLTSNCDCRKSSLYVLKSYDKVYVQSGSNNILYNFSDVAYNTAKITCDLYNVFSRGPNQKVIGLSLYGNDPFYYNSIKTISKLAKKYYPGWVVRIYYDFSINDTAICELECLKENDEYINNVDFCNVNKIPFGSAIDSWTALYMHKMTWRWLPIGDSFVDYFMSRDTDAWITEREYESVKVWFKSENVFHIMRGK